VFGVNERDLVVFDKEAARGWAMAIPVPEQSPGLWLLRRRVWGSLVDAADEQGRVRITAAQIAAGLYRGRHRRPGVPAVRNAMAWLRKHGWVVTVQAATGTDQCNVYQLTTTPPVAAVPPVMPVQPGVRAEAPARPDPDLAAAQEWLSADAADEQLAEDIAHWVAGIWTVRDGGPSWEQTARQVRPELAGLPEHARRHYTRGLIQSLREDGWLACTRDEGSLDAGHRLKPRHPTAATAARHTTGVADRGY